MIQLSITSTKGHMHGFSHFWGQYVTGFNTTKHCLECLLGTRSKIITRTMACDGAPFSMAEAEKFDYLYLCGVTRTWARNFHMVLRPQEGGKAHAKTFNGTVIKAEGAVLIPIPWLRNGHNGMPLEFTTCRNYQFATAAYGQLSCSSVAA